MPRAGPDTGVPFAPAQGLGTEDTRVRLRCCRLNATLWAAFPQQESTAALSPLGASARQPHPKARGHSPPQGRGRCFVSVSCALYFPCVACTHPSLRARTPFAGSDAGSRLTRHPRGAVGDRAGPRVVQQRHLLLDASAAPRGRRRLPRRPRSGFLRSPPRTHASPRGPRSQLRPSRSPGKAWCGVGLGERDQRLWIPTVCVPGVVLADDDHRYGWDTVPDPLWKETAQTRITRTRHTRGWGPGSVPRQLWALEGLLKL